MTLLNSLYDETRALSIRVKAKNLDGVHPFDDTGQRLVDHLCQCLRCLMTVIKQTGSLHEAGCPEFLRLLGETTTSIDARRSPLANVHATEEIIEEYCFGRLTFIETKILEAHLVVCRDCSMRLEHRKQFIAVLRGALTRKAGSRPLGITGVSGFDEETGKTVEIGIARLSR